ncbi:MAG: hypothetical protein ACO1TE_17470 [Prosthecobacter sp.]
MNRTAVILGFVALMVVYHTAGALFGPDAKFWFLVDLLLVSAVLTFLISWLRRGSSDGQSGSHENENDNDDFEDIIPVPGPRLRGMRRHVDSALGLVAAFGPPVLVQIWRGGPLSLDTSFTLHHFLAMVGGVILYYLLRPWIWRA